MAMARKPPDLAGKMGGLAVGSNCDLCDATKSIKYCAECNVKLCATCTKGHGVLPITKDHPLLDLTMLRSGSSYAKSGDTESGPCPCAKHNLELLKFYCEECKLIICRECRKDHNGHSIKALKDDVKIYQAICTEHIKSLLDKSHDLEGRKLLVDGIFTNYDETIELVKKWEKDLVELVKECSRSLRDDLDKTKKEWENVVNDKEKGLKSTMTNVENEISKLHSIRKVSDVDIFSYELAASQRLLERVNNFMENILPTLNIPGIDDILPNMAQLPLLKTGIRNLMSSKKASIISNQDPTFTSSVHLHTTRKAISPHTQFNTACPLPNLNSLSLKSRTKISDPNSYNGYGISDSFIDNDHVMVYGACKNDIRIVNLNDQSLEMFSSECEIWAMTTIGLNEHVAVRLHSLYLLNSKFAIVNSRTTEMYCKDISYLAEHRFVLLEADENDEKSAHISIIYIKGGEFRIEQQSKVKVAGQMELICTDIHERSLFMCGGSHLYKVNLDNWSIQYHRDMKSQKVTQPWSMGVFGTYLLVADGAGAVYRLNKNLEYMKIFLDVGMASPVRGISCVNGYLVLTTSGNDIFIYK